MLSQIDIENIKKTAAEFFKKASFEVEIELLPQVDLTLPIKLKTNDPETLIGDNGQTLSEIQRLLKSILKRKIKENFYISLDINDYKEKKVEELKEIARAAADEVVLTKKEKILPPMPAYERRVVHLDLAGRKDVSTESVGREPERRIVLKPCP